MRVCIDGGYKLKTCCLSKTLHLVQSISPLIMSFHRTSEYFIVLVTLCKDRHIVFVDVLLFVIIILPDKTAVLSVLSDCCISDNISVLVQRIKIKDKDPLWEKKIVYQFKGLYNILILKKIIDTVTDTDNCPGCAVKIKFSHILFKIHDIKTSFAALSSGNIKHLRGKINSHYIVAFFCHYHRKASGSTAKLHHKVFLLIKSFCRIF